MAQFTVLSEKTVAWWKEAVSTLSDKSSPWYGAAMTLTCVICAEYTTLAILINNN